MSQIIIISDKDHVISPTHYFNLSMSEDLHFLNCCHCHIFQIAFYILLRSTVGKIMFILTTHCVPAEWLGAHQKCMMVTDKNLLSHWCEDIATLYSVLSLSTDGIQDDSELYVYPPRKYTAASLWIQIMTSSLNSMDSSSFVTRKCPFLYDVPLYCMSKERLVLCSEKPNSLTACLIASL